MEDHTHLSTQHHSLALGHLDKVAVVVKNLSFCRSKQSNDILHQYRLATTALTNDQIGYPFLEDGIDVLQNILVLE